MAISRRRSTATADPVEETRERPTRRRSGAGDSERPSRRRGGSDSAQDEESPRSERPTRRRSGRGGDSDSRPSRRRGAGGFASYSQKKRSNSAFADEFKPESDRPTLIKFLDPEPFDTFNQHWVTDGMAKGSTRHSFVCRQDDEFFDDDDGCPLCDLGEDASTYSLFNVIDLTNIRKPEVKVWKTSPVVTDKLMRLAQASRTKPLDREDLYFEVTMVKKSKKTEWDIVPLKADDLVEEDDYREFSPFEPDEIESFAEKKFEDRTAITKVDSYDDLAELADSLD